MAVVTAQMTLTYFNRTMVDRGYLFDGKPVELATEQHGGPVLSTIVNGCQSVPPQSFCHLVWT